MTGAKTEIDGEIPMRSLTVGTDFDKLIPSTFRYSFIEMGIQENLRDKKPKPDMYIIWAMLYGMLMSTL